MSQWLSWVSEKDFEKHEGWFLNYLGRNNLLPPSYTRTTYLAPQERIQHLSNHLALSHQHNPHWVELTIKKMKGAWAQKVRRMNSPHDKPYNFFMSKTVQNHLRQIAKANKTNINKALELLILDESKLIHNLQQAHREDIKRLKESFERRRARQLTSVANLQAVADQEGHQSSPSSEQPEMSITLTMDELEALISKEVARKINETLIDHKEQPHKAPEGENQDKGNPEPSATEPDNDLTGQPEPDEPQTPFAKALQKAIEKGAQ